MVPYDTYMTSTQKHQLIYIGGSMSSLCYIYSKGPGKLGANFCQIYQKGAKLLCSLVLHIFLAENCYFSMTGENRSAQAIQYMEVGH
jgi:hypothetical protein